MANFLLVFVIAYILTWLARRARGARARYAGDVLIFSPLFASDVGYMLVFLTGIGFVIAGIFENEGRILLTTSGVVFALFSIFKWPKPILTSSSGIRQRNWYGRWREIPWAYVKEVKEKKGGLVVVQSSDDGSITLSQYHVGHDDFLKEIYRHWHGSVPQPGAPS